MNTHMVQKGSNKDANVTGVFTRLNNNENSHVFIGNLKMSQEYKSGESTRGYSGKLGVQNK